MRQDRGRGAMMDLEPHEAARFFAERSTATIQEMASDIRRHGLRQPIELFEGKILDGRARYAACQLAGVPPRFRQLDDVASPLTYVIRAYLKQRPRSEGPRAMIGARAVSWFQKEAAERRPQGGGSPCERAAAAVEVSTRLLSDGLKLRREAPVEVVRAAEEGRAGVHSAAGRTRMSREEQIAFVSRRGGSPWDPTVDDVPSYEPEPPSSAPATEGKAPRTLDPRSLARLEREEQVRRLHEEEHLSGAEIAKRLRLHPSTVQQIKGRLGLLRADRRSHPMQKLTAFVIEAVDTLALAIDRESVWKHASKEDRADLNQGLKTLRNTASTLLRATEKGTP